MKEYKFNKMNFFQTLIEESIKAIKRGTLDLERLYSGYERLILNQINISPETEAECNELIQILKRSYRMFKDPEVVDILIKNNITYKQFISKYGEKLLGDNKRKYDMSDRFEETLIGYQNKERKISYIQKEGMEHIYFDGNGKKVTIQEIGRLIFKEWNGLKSSLSEYKITRQLNGQTYQRDNVFSNIRIIMMDHPEYREAVLGELLSRNNIELSKAGGYVGQIEDVTIGDREFKEGSEITADNDYFYKVSPNYMLAYHSAELTAAMIMKNARKEKRKLESSDITKMIEKQRTDKTRAAYDTKGIVEKKAEGESR